jgi:hypothetical protein
MSGNTVTPLSLYADHIAVTRHTELIYEMCYNVYSCWPCRRCCLCPARRTVVCDRSDEPRTFQFRNLDVNCGQILTKFGLCGRVSE